MIFFGISLSLSGSLSLSLSNSLSLSLSLSLYKITSELFVCWVCLVATHFTPSTSSSMALKFQRQQGEKNTYKSWAQHMKEVLNYLPSQHTEAAWNGMSIPPPDLNAYVLAKKETTWAVFLFMPSLPKESFTTTHLADKVKEASLFFPPQPTRTIAFLCYVARNKKESWSSFPQLQIWPRFMSPYYPFSKYAGPSYVSMSPSRIPHVHNRKTTPQTTLRL